VLAKTPYGKGSKLTHLVGSDQGGGFEGSILAGHVYFELARNVVPHLIMAMSASDPKQTRAIAVHMSAFDPKRTLDLRPTRSHRAFSEDW